MTAPKVEAARAPWSAEEAVDLAHRAGFSGTCWTVGPEELVHILNMVNAQPPTPQAPAVAVPLSTRYIVQEVDKGMQSFYKAFDTPTPPTKPLAPEPQDAPTDAQIEGWFRDVHEFVSTGDMMNYGRYCDKLYWVKAAVHHFVSETKPVG